jgi:glyoxylase-like metal-dependent hydrolase (beta-lactamase superfamily II)
MNMIFEQINTGGDRNFAYLVGDESTGKAAVVDPANNPKKVLSRAAKHGLKVVYLFNTHGHSDHTSGNDLVLKKTDAELIRGGPGGAEDGAVYTLGEVTLKVIHTPGHTQDSLCVLASVKGEPGKLITGDTLFVGKVGGTGFGQDARDEYDALHSKLMTLPEETEVWPGHDYGVAPSSTIGNELKTNPFILRESFEAFLDLKKNWLAYKAEHGIK